MINDIFYFLIWTILVPALLCVVLSVILRYHDKTQLTTSELMPRRPFVLQALCFAMLPLLLGVLMFILDFQNGQRSEVRDLPERAVGTLGVMALLYLLASSMRVFAYFFVLRRNSDEADVHGKIRFYETEILVLHVLNVGIGAIAIRYAITGFLW